MQSLLELHTFGPRLRHTLLLPSLPSFSSLNPSEFPRSLPGREVFQIGTKHNNITDSLAEITENFVTQDTARRNRFVHSESRTPNLVFHSHIARFVYFPRSLFSGIVLQKCISFGNIEDIHVARHWVTW